MKNFQKLVSAILYIFMVFLLAPPAVTAQTDGLTEMFLFTNDELVSVAARYEQRVADAPSAVSIITEEDIRRIPAKNLLELLEYLPGTTVSTSVSNRNSIYFRGQNPGAIKLMIDGLSVNDTMYGDFDFWSNMSTDIIKKIEVVRGPGSSLYGSDAFSGVINIVTKKGSDIKGAQTIATAGSFELSGGAVLIGDNLNEDTSYKILVSQAQTDGDHNILERDQVKAYPYTRVPGPMNDGYWNTVMNMAIENDKFYIRSLLMVSQQDSLVGQNNALVDSDHRELDQYSLDSQYNFALRENILLSPRFYFHYLEQAVLNGEVLPENYYLIVASNPPYIPKDFNGDGLLEYWPEGIDVDSGHKEERWGTELKLDVDIDDENKWINGLFFERIRIFDTYTRANAHPVTQINAGGFVDFSYSANFNSGGERELYGMYSQYTKKFWEDWSFISGFRYENYDDFGNTINPRSALIWNFNDKGTFKAMYGTAFRAATFSQLYHTNNPIVIGNPNLNPEKIETVDFNLDYQWTSKLHSSISVYKSNIRDGIAIDAASKTSPSAPYLWGNVLDVQTRGLDLETKYNVTKKSYLFGSFSYVDSEKGAQDMPDIPQHSSRCGFNWNFAQYFNWYTAFRYDGKRPRDDVGGDTRPFFKDYLVTDTSLAFEDWIQGLSIKLIVRNLFDEDYDYPSLKATDDFQRANREYIGSISYKIDF